MESSRGQVWGAHRLQLVVRRKSCVPLFVAWASFMQALPGIVDRVPQVRASGQRNSCYKQFALRTSGILDTGHHQ